MVGQHERYREIVVQQCNPYCPQTGVGKLLIIVYLKDDKFRSHAVSHLANLLELEYSWRKWLSPTQNKIVLQTISDLGKLNCPFLILRLAKPPCSTCQSYQICTGVVADLEKAYLGIIEEVLQEGGNLPRYACFILKEKNVPVYYTMPTDSIVVKAALSGAYYNVMTCYCKAGISVPEFYDRQSKKIREEANDVRNIIWCNESNWGLTRTSIITPSQSTLPARQKGPKQRYSRRSGGFRQYLDDLDD